jgi:hypothetical protein
MRFLGVAQSPRKSHGRTGRDVTAPAGACKKKSALLSDKLAMATWLADSSGKRHAAGRAPSVLHGRQGLGEK